ncbi:MAG: hypothetical protein RDV48_18330 [Candidatus Eremiobacteraeota bacterium]|nr:hypothetical protein [Candidatus Eremiobacteraeota bacterium]
MNGRRFLFILLCFLAFPVPCRADDNEEVLLIFSSGGKGYKSGDTVAVKAGSDLKILAKVFVKQFAVKGGHWKKNPQGEWRYFKKIRGYSVGVGVGKMSLNVLKQEYRWVLEGEPPQSQKEFTWHVPPDACGDSTIKITTVTQGQIKTEGTASLHGLHLDYNLPGAGKREFKGEALLHLHISL